MLGAFGIACWNYGLQLCKSLRILCLVFALQENSLAILAHMNIIGPALAECLKDGSTPVRLAAERCALHAFQLTKGIFFKLSYSFTAIVQMKIFQWLSCRSNKCSCYSFCYIFSRSWKCSSCTKIHHRLGC